MPVACSGENQHKWRNQHIPSQKHRFELYKQPTTLMKMSKLVQYPLLLFNDKLSPDLLCCLQQAYSALVMVPKQQLWHCCCCGRWQHLMSGWRRPCWSWAHCSSYMQCPPPAAAPAAWQWQQQVQSLHLQQQ